MPGYRKEDTFELPVLYQQQEIILPATLVQMGYTYKIYVRVGEHEIVFEPDEERNLRAILEKENNNRSITKELILAIGVALEKYLR
jgi:hypothetical protein